jgi:hypothetical protein
MDFFKASWVLLGSGVEVGLAPNTPPTPGFKTFCDPRGYAMGIMPCILGREAYLDFYVGGSASCSKMLVLGQIKLVPPKTQNVVAPPHQLTKA